MGHSEETVTEVEGEFVSQPLYTILAHSQPHL